MTMLAPESTPIPAEGAMAHSGRGTTASGIFDRTRLRPARLSDLAEALLRAPSTLTGGERELIATVVSRRDQRTARTVVPAKLRALALIADKVRTDVATVTEQDAAAARAAGATEREIQEAMLIAAAFWLVA
jgi:alkylhydroperoxidase family enzyme